MFYYPWLQTVAPLSYIWRVYLQLFVLQYAQCFVKWLQIFWFITQSTNDNNSEWIILQWLILAFHRAHQFNWHNFIFFLFQGFFHSLLKDNDLLYFTWPKNSATYCHFHCWISVVRGERRVGENHHYQK